MTTPPISGPDAEVLRYLAQIVAIGRHKKAWTAATVIRVAVNYLRPRFIDPPKPPPKPPPPRTRTVKPGNHPIPDKPYTVELGPRQVEILRHWRDGASRQQIAVDLGISASTVSNQLTHIRSACRAHDRQHLAALLNAGVLRVETRQPRKKAA